MSITNPTNNFVHSSFNILLMSILTLIKIVLYPLAIINTKIVIRVAIYVITHCLCLLLFSGRPKEGFREKMEARAAESGGGGGGGVKKITSACDVEALKRCLEENKGDYVKCQSQIEAFKSSCSLKKPNSASDSK